MLLEQRTPVSAVVHTGIYYTCEPCRSAVRELDTQHQDTDPMRCPVSEPRGTVLDSSNSVMSVFGEEMLGIQEGCTLCCMIGVGVNADFAAAKPVSTSQLRSASVCSAHLVRWEKPLTVERARQAGRRQGKYWWVTSCCFNAVSEPGPEFFKQPV
ncbi:Hypothetical predicted protein [Pelobates cultripes]|uniref:Uncharacterized protein n=1 Tax=Pelobates cultripes TaxID=61616 RepID=A0AAD1T818_PELCU|nr:Hypothetical predicted protein [Pelobates cultripes]